MDRSSLDFLDNSDPFLLASGSGGARIGAGCVPARQCIHVLALSDGRFWLTVRSRSPNESRLTLDKNKYAQYGRQNNGSAHVHE
jgi:hypothetical protein